jgi:ABC-type multidrug transport system permease subunit
MLERLLKGFLVSLTTMLFVLVLPFLLGLLLIPSLPPDDRWFLKMALTFLSPFSAVLWFIAFSHLVLRRRAGYFKQFVVFVGTAAVIYLLLINGVYHL